MKFWKVAAVLSVALAAPAHSQTTSSTMTVRDGAAASQALRVDKNPDNSLATHSVPEVGGAPVSPANPLAVQSAPLTSIPLDASTVTTSGTAVTALTSAHHGKGGWIRNCNASGNLFVNDISAATTTEAGSNAALSPGTLGAGQQYPVPSGAQIISVNASVSGMKICGEGYN